MFPILALMALLLAGCQLSPQSRLGWSYAPTVTPSLALSQASPTRLPPDSTAQPSPSPTIPILPSPTITDPPTLEPPSPIHALRLDFPDYAKSRSEIDILENKMQQSGVNLVALGAGRPDWTYFKWSGHESQWSGDVADSGIDFLAQDSRRFSDWARVDAVVDVYAPRYIQEHPDKAANSWLGQPSQYLVNTIELVDGEYGQLLLDMIEAIAANYPVDSISITELIYYTEGYSDPDKVAYMAYTGNKDWPRLLDGKINIDHPSIGEWRSYEIGRFLQKASAVTSKYGKELYIDVGVSWAAPGNLGLEKGNRYDIMLQSASRVIVWDYFALNDYPAEITQEIAQVLTSLGAERSILSIGLWAKNNQVITPDQLSIALDSARRGGIHDLWITPSDLLTDAHWQVLQSFYTMP